MKLSRIGITLMLILVWLLNGTQLPTARMSEDRLNVSNTASSSFGASVSLDGDTAIVGAPGRDTAYILYRNQGGSDVWGGVKSLSPSGLTDAGGTVAVSGDIAVVGAPDEAVNIFYRNLGGLNNWGPVKLIQGGYGFGSSVAIYGDTLIVGEWATTVGGKLYCGAAYIYQRNQGGADNWGLVKQLVAPDCSPDDEFGGSVAINGDIVVVGADGVDIAGKESQGAAYIFYRNQGGANNWGQVKKIIATDGAALDFFGDYVSIYAERIVIAAPLADVSGNADQGAAYVFYRTQGGSNNWGQVKKIVAADGSWADRFGSSVSIYQDTLAIGAPAAGIGSNSHQGAAYIFYRTQGGAENWGQVRKLSASDGASGDYFGNLQVSGSTVVIGAPMATIGGSAYQGAAYVFYRDQGGANNWGQVKKLLLPFAAVTGQVSNTRAQPVYNATISIEPSASVMVKTGSDGRYSLPISSSGIYTLVVDRAEFGVLPPRHAIDVSGDLSGIDFVLPPIDDAIVNGGWETGDLSGWSAGTGLTHTVEMTAAHTGRYGLRLESSGSGGFDFEPSITQTVVISAGWARPTLSWLYQGIQATPGDAVLIAVSHEGTLITGTVPITTGMWLHEWLDLSAFSGQTVTLQFGFQTQAAGQQIVLDEICVGDSTAGVYSIYLPLIRRS
jgi:hypothetical protein